ncbi:MULTISPECIES: DUF7555 family protein [Haloferax]|uniref:Uncharacterized protein n=1 Tax=Haloferax massiliensis TaxID=1476858 RepID=A0A0D6JNP0_9EURY|nr:MULTISPECIES: hypothetical protein [Haloferax]MDS0242522.1 hypothetical protein [Haloferax sp. S2CR25]MDS0445643.1 hypothetical protein [Haloferax sp. S2CR25-2]CQR49223.1 hypothetical protein BN996_00680 [Haloferax massiliensis]
MEFDPRRLGVKAIDAVVYAVSLTGVVFVVTAVVSTLAGNGLPGAKWLMFFLGFAMFGYASLKVRPKAAWKRGDGNGGNGGNGDSDGGLFSGSDEPVGVEKLVGDALDAILPPRLRPATGDERPSSGVKLLLASVCILATSYAMEVVFEINY